MSANVPVPWILWVYINDIISHESHVKSWPQDAFQWTLHLHLQTHGCFRKWWVLPPNHPLKNRVFHYKSSIWGSPIFGNTHMSTILHYTFAAWDPLKHLVVFQRFLQPTPSPKTVKPTNFEPRDTKPRQSREAVFPFYPSMLTQVLSKNFPTYPRTAY